MELLIETNTPAQRLIPLETLDRNQFRNLKGICFDIDDTFSTHGKITPEAFQSLWDLKHAGFTLIPVTGRPAGWCDHIARFWPVDAVVGENGAFTFFMHERNGTAIRNRFDTLPAAEVTSAQSKLQALQQKILVEFPHARFASDQAYREFDLAIDFCEDVNPWPESEVERLVQVCQAAGAIAKISSIHVNAWFGKYTKIEGIRAFLAHAKTLGIDLPEFKDFIFAGDSPNDEPMFQAFEHSVGVANVRPFLSKMQTPPRYITASEAGAGFVELAKFLQK